MRTPEIRGDRRRAFVGRYLLLTTGIGLVVAAYLAVSLAVDLNGDTPPPTPVVVLRAIGIVIALGAAPFSLYLRARLGLGTRR